MHHPRPQNWGSWVDSAKDLCLPSPVGDADAHSGVRPTESWSYLQIAIAQVWMLSPVPGMGVGTAPRSSRKDTEEDDISGGLWVEKGDG